MLDCCMVKKTNNTAKDNVCGMVCSVISLFDIYGRSSPKYFLVPKMTVFMDERGNDE